MRLKKKKNSLISGVKNIQRRNFLKYSALVAGGFIVGKTLDSVLRVLSSKKGFELVGPEGEKTTAFDNFVVRESREELKISDKTGYEIFIIEK